MATPPAPVWPGPPCIERLRSRAPPISPDHNGNQHPKQGHQLGSYLPPRVITFPPPQHASPDIPPNVAYNSRG